MDKCAGSGNLCMEGNWHGGRICSGDYIAISVDDLNYNCCLTDDAGVAEVLNDPTNTRKNALIKFFGFAVFVMLTLIHFHYAAEKIRKGTAKASLDAQKDHYLSE